MIRSIILLLALAWADAAEWTPVTWRDEAAWVSSQGDWTAVVSRERCRLVALDHRDGRSLLFVPRAPPGSLAANGGHQAWLGPQSAWRWPPPPMWERLPARAHRLDGDTLVLQGAQDDPAWPALERRYAWVGTHLRLTVSWAADGKPRHCIHVLQVPIATQVSLVAIPSADLPEGAGLRYGWSPSYQPVPLNVPFPPGVVRSGDRLVLGAAVDSRKLYVASQPIITRLGDLQMTLHPGATTGMEQGAPDLGLTSQVFHGPGYDYLEIEQISADLAGPPGTILSSWVELDAQAAAP